MLTEHQPERPGTAKAPEPEKLTLSVEEAARALGIGRGLAYEGVRTGAIPAVRIGNRLLVPRIALEQMLSNAAS